MDGELTILFRTCIYDARAGVRELGMLHPVLLAQQALFVPPLLNVVYLYSLIARRCQYQIAVVVVVNRLDVRLRPAILDIISPKQLAEQRLARILGSAKGL